VQKHVEPGLRSSNLASEPGAGVRSLREKVRDGVSSPTTIDDIRTVLRIARNRAVKGNLTERNVSALTDAPRRVRTERAPLTPEHARAFFSAKGRA
jgi:hypothetical protein